MSFNHEQNNKSIKPYQTDGMSLMAQSNPSYMYVFKKLEKIVSALFAVTNLFPESDMLKTELRESGIGALKTVAHTETREKESQDLIPYLLEISSLLDVAFHAGLLSDMNRTVLARECTQLIGHIQSALSSNEESFLSESFFKTEEYFKRPAISQTENVQNDGIKKPIQKQAPQKTYKPAASQVSQKNDRQEKIISLIKDKKKVSISDISKVITGCSEKTIQRELVTLVGEGVLIKQGERRWSTYSLK